MQGKIKICAADFFAKKTRNIKMHTRLRKNNYHPRVLAQRPKPEEAP